MKMLQCFTGKIGPFFDSSSFTILVKLSFTILVKLKTRIFAEISTLKFFKTKTYSFWLRFCKNTNFKRKKDVGGSRRCGLPLKTISQHVSYYGPNAGFDDGPIKTLECGASRRQSVHARSCATRSNANHQQGYQPRLRAVASRTHFLKNSEKRFSR